MFNLFSKCREQNNYKEHIEKQKKTVKIDTLPYFTETIDPYISIYEGALSEELCDDIIKYYTKNKHLQRRGETIGGLDSNIKNTIDMPITCAGKDNIELKNLDILLKNNLTHYAEKYCIEINNTLDNSFLITGSMHDTGYHMQTYKKNEGCYNCHTDDNSRILSNEIHTRVLTFIWYLNDVSEGGETVFINKCKIKPKKGSLLFFPALWTYHHCGMVPESNDKYIITGWMYNNSNNEQIMD